MITKRRLLFLSGIILVLNAVVFGLPFVYESSLNIALGLFVIVIAFLLGRTKPAVHGHHKKRGRSSEIYAENRPGSDGHVPNTSDVYDMHEEPLAEVSGSNHDNHEVDQLENSSNER